MITYLVYGMVYLGSAIMLYNITGFLRFVRYIRGREAWTKESGILYLPVALLVMFLIGYLIVGFLGEPDLVVSGILFGGSIFVYVMYRLLNNITEHIISHEHLEAELAAAEESNRAKNQFLANMSHEMRTPMNVILGLNTLVLKNPSLDEKGQAQLRAMERSGKLLLSLINKMLDMNNIGNGALLLKEEDFCLAVALHQAMEILEAQCEEKGLQCRSCLCPQAEAWYTGDAMLLKQALLEIMDNAVKFTDVPGTVSFEVQVEAQTDADVTFDMCVTDTGIGIDSDFLPRIYGLFSREDESATDRYGGSGLGLVTAKKKVELMGGRIEVQSEKHVGSSFHVVIPLKISTQPHPQSSEAVQDVSLKGCRILIVDDHPENAEIVADLLELEDAESETAENGKIALEMFCNTPIDYYDAIIMDLRMPVMDGLEATRQIRALDREDARKVPILALTANAYESDIQETRQAGMNAHLTKPVEADVLYAELERAIREARKETKQA